MLSEFLTCLSSDWLVLPLKMTSDIAILLLTMFLWYMLSLSLLVISFYILLWMLTLICSGLITSGRCYRESRTSLAKLKFIWSWWADPVPFLLAAALCSWSTCILLSLSFSSKKKSKASWSFFFLEVGCLHVYQELTSWLWHQFASCSTQRTSTAIKRAIASM